VNRGQFERFCKVVERPDLASDSRFSDNAQRIEHRKALREEIEHSIDALTRRDLCDKLMQNGVPEGPINSVSEASSQPHTVSADGRAA
jgi:crotonobetainyl-CoA:carnitine CoA-transferase CaiB-like acyl-CoA transferase